MLRTVALLCTLAGCVAEKVVAESEGAGAGPSACPSPLELTLDSLPGAPGAWAEQPHSEFPEVLARAAFVDMNQAISQVVRQVLNGSAHTDFARVEEDTTHLEELPLRGIVPGRDCAVSGFLRLRSAGGDAGSLTMDLSFDCPDYVLFSRTKHLGGAFRYVSELRLSAGFEELSAQPGKASDTDVQAGTYCAHLSGAVAIWGAEIGALTFTLDQRGSARKQPFAQPRLRGEFLVRGAAVTRCAASYDGTARAFEISCSEGEE